MAHFTVSEVAALAHISVRTLHHYHEIGLLVPAHVGANGYRYYGREELERLQQILIHRELGIPLGEIGTILDAPDFNRLAVLKNQRQRIATDIARSTEILKTIDRTIAEIEGDQAMNESDMYSGIVDPKKQADYEAWLERQYGPDISDQFKGGQRKMASLDQHARAAAMSELLGIEQGIAQAMRDGTPHQAQLLDPLIIRHFAWVQESWGADASLKAYAGLAEIYTAHPDFVSRYEQIEPGFAEYFSNAIKSWVSRQI